jgi:hypothetical protein
MYEGVDTVVLYDQLAYHDVLPVQWLALPSAPDQFELIGIEEANLLLLHACVAVEEHSVRDKSEELGALAGEIARLDFKLNLVMQLLSKLIARDKMPPPTSINFNGVGASWTCIGKPPKVGEHGLLRVQLRSSVPQPLEIPAEVVGVDGSTAKVKFPDISEALVELIQKLAFLRHRRQIADVRKARG